MQAWPHAIPDCRDHRCGIRFATRPCNSILKLDQFLKFQGLVGTGGEAKLRIQRGDVRVNGSIEIRRGRQLALGDAVAIDGREVLFQGQRPSGH